MAALASFGISILLQPSFANSATVTNPVNSIGFQGVAPWGKTSVRSSVKQVLYDLADKAGDMQGGFMGAYMSAQTLNGATSSGAPTPYTNANEL
jgi:hypothetical protein